MGQSESSLHVPNPVFDWLPRLEATLIQSASFKKPTSWKLNTIASLPDPPYTLFAANGSSVFYYDVSNNPEVLLPVGTMLGEAPEDDSINQLRMLKITGIHRLVAVFDTGLILVWDPVELSKKPLRLHQLIGICSNDSVSTWSLAGDAVAPFLYVGSNAHHVVSFRLSANNVQNTRELVMKHEHNVPCVDVSPCGKFLATASIDSTICITHIPSKTILGKVKLAQWSWSCLWIPKSQIMTFKPSDDRIGWLSEIFNKDSRTPSFETVDASHYDLLDEDQALEEAPPAKKRVLNMEGMQIENLEHMEILEEDDDEAGEEDDGEVEIQVEENGFAAMEEEEEDDEIVAVGRRRMVNLMADDEEESIYSDLNPFAQWEPSQKSDKKMEMEQIEISSPVEYLLFGATFDELFLFDHHLKILARTTNPLPRREEDSMVLTMLERFFFTFWIPEWSILLSANQGIPAIYISTLRFNTLDCQYQIHPEATLPRPSERDHHLKFVLSGVSCYRINSDPSLSAQDPFFYRLHFRLGDLMTYDLRLTKGKLSVSQSPQASPSRSN